MKEAGQEGCNTGGVQNRKVGRNEGRHDRKDAGQERCETGGMQRTRKDVDDRKDAVQYECRTGRIQDRKMQDRRNAEQEGWQERREA